MLWPFVQAGMLDKRLQALSLPCLADHHTSFALDGLICTRNLCSVTGPVKDVKARYCDVEIQT